MSKSTSHLYTCQRHGCGAIFRSYNPTPKYCSRKCKDAAQEVGVSFETAKELYESDASQVEVAEQLGTTQKVIYSLFKRHGYICRVAAKRNQLGDANHQWKGVEATYSAFHRRVEARFGRPNKCEVCGTTSPDATYDWANLTGNYPDPEDYKRMCRSCHHSFDGRVKNLRPKGGDA